MARSATARQLRDRDPELELDAERLLTRLGLLLRLPLDPQASDRENIPEIQIDAAKYAVPSPVAGLVFAAGRDHPPELAAAREGHRLGADAHANGVEQAEEGLLERVL